MTYLIHFALIQMDDFFKEDILLPPSVLCPELYKWIEVRIFYKEELKF